ncbi:MAG: DUF3859 domain-containing protein [Planctomycetota bacterium]
MARKRPVIQEVNYGLYERFDAKGKGLPKLLAFTTAVPAVMGQEFGFIIKIKHGRGLRIDFEIDHPQVPDQDGEVMAPFRGEVFVRGSDFDFFLGDALWEPIESMLGEWTLSTKLDGKEVNRRTFEVVALQDSTSDRLSEWDDLPMQ